MLNLLQFTQLQGHISALILLARICSRRMSSICSSKIHQYTFEVPFEDMRDPLEDTHDPDQDTHTWFQVKTFYDPVLDIL